MRKEVFMKEIKTVFVLLLCCLAMKSYSQQTVNVSGKVVSERNIPIEGAVITIDTVSNIRTGKDGTFQLEAVGAFKQLSIWAPGYFPVEQHINGRSEIKIVMIDEEQTKYNESMVKPIIGFEESFENHTTAKNIAKKDFVLGRSKIDQALMGQVAGLQVKPSSGMPGEGSYWNLRGVRTLVGDNAPLFVVDGIPFMPDKSSSKLIGGFTRDIFQAFNIQDIQNITVLKGAETSLYGSMGSNGVILIETDGAASNNLQTSVSYYGQSGVNWNNKRIPLLSGAAYTAYLTDAAMTTFADMNTLYSNFPFLNNPNDPRYVQLYNNDTDWQELIYGQGFVNDHLFRVEGGDAIAKYDFSLGYMSTDGLVESTKLDRYHSRLNADVVISPKLNAGVSVGLAYINGTYQEQGLNHSTNPILAAYARSPILSPFNKDLDGNILSTYAPYHYGNNSNRAYAVSNPLAIVNTLDARNRQYDMNLRASLTYRPTQALVFNGVMGIYYNYNNEHLFVPGMTDNTIIPVTDGSSTAYNSVSDGVAETVNTFYNLNGRYNKTFNDVHRFSAFAGMQILTTRNEYDAGKGRNTPNDFYQTLTSTTQTQRFLGYLNTWNWMNFYGNVEYTYKDVLQAGINLSFDGASSTGVGTNRFNTYPSVSLAFLGKGWEPIQGVDFIDKLNVRASYGITGNSRYASTLGKYYYRSMPYDNLSTIVRANVPNVNLGPEKNNSLNLGLDFAVFRNRVGVTVDYYHNQIKDMIGARPVSSVYGSSPYYDNIGSMTNKGVELDAYASVVRTNNFEWILGGNIAFSKSQVTSLGGVDQIVNEGEDGLRFITQVGESPYQFYGYQQQGVFSTQAQADAANLTNPLGYRFQAGDIHFVDQNNDGVINESDRVVLGNATPDFFGGFYTQFRYKSFSLSSEFVYSSGNLAYNAVRQRLESMNTLNNQSEAVLNRWVVEGQVTNMPRASYGDPHGNAAFSDRWIEDASYLRMRNLTLNYDFNKTFLNFFRSGVVYVTAENILTFSKYLGTDPEFSYAYADNLQGLDYAKVMQPKTFKIGANLKF